MLDYRKREFTLPILAQRISQTTICTKLKHNTIDTCVALLIFLLLNGVPSKASSSYPLSCSSSISRNSRLRANDPVFDDIFPVAAAIIYFTAEASDTKLVLS